jgi:hypothetical protein
MVMDEGSSEQQEEYDYPDIEPVSWSASEFIAHDKTGGWYLLLGIGAAVVTVLVYVITRNTFSALVIAFACVVFGIFAARKPQTKQYTLDENGIQADDKFYLYENFKSFSVVFDGGMGCIWLRPLRRIVPTVAMYYAPEDEDRIIMMLENFLPMEDREHDVIDRLSRRIRF